MTTDPVRAELDELLANLPHIDVPPITADDLVPTTTDDPYVDTHGYYFPTDRPGRAQALLEAALDEPDA